VTAWVCDLISHVTMTEFNSFLIRKTEITKYLPHGVVLKIKRLNTNKPL
jgi:uncharacterized protein YifN (PemK superfamily)